VAERQRRTDRRRISAAGAVRGYELHERCGQEQFGLAVEEKINRLAGLFQMAAFQQHRAAVSGINFPRGGAQMFRRGDILSRQNSGLVQVRRHQRGEWQQPFLEDFFRRRLQQPRAARGNHHRVNNQSNISEGRSPDPTFCLGPAPPKKIRDNLDIFWREQHAGFHGARRQFFKHGLDLLPQHFRRARFDTEDAPRILRGETGDGAGAVDAERGEGFQIRLDARAAAAVGTGDGQGDGQLFSRSHFLEINAKARRSKGAKTACGLR